MFIFNFSNEELLIKTMFCISKLFQVPYFYLPTSNHSNSKWQPNSTDNSRSVDDFAMEILKILQRVKCG